jgi:hypothetical protein
MFFSHAAEGLGFGVVSGHQITFFLALLSLTTHRCALVVIVVIQPEHCCIVVHIRFGGCTLIINWIKFVCATSVTYMSSVTASLYSV